MDAQRAPSRPYVLPPVLYPMEEASLYSVLRRATQQPTIYNSFKIERCGNEQSTMATAIVPPGGAPPVPVTPQPPFEADPGTIVGWFLDTTVMETSSAISRGLELGFNQLVNNIPTMGDYG
jgi:hypothetical protein